MELLGILGMIKQTCWRTSKNHCKAKKLKYENKSNTKQSGNQRSNNKSNTRESKNQRSNRSERKSKKR